MTTATIKWVETYEGCPPSRCFDRDRDMRACERSSYDYIETLEGCDDDATSTCDSVSSYTKPTQDRIRNFVKEKGISGDVRVVYTFGFSGPKDNIIGQPLLHRCGIDIFENGHLVAEGEATDISGSRQLVNESSIIHGSLTDCFEKATNDLVDPASSSKESEEDMSGGKLKSITRPVIYFFHSVLTRLKRLFS